MRRVYMDYAASAPVDPRVIEAMRPYFSESYGNPSSTHSMGTEARAADDEARTRVAHLIGAERKEEIIFTSGATESNNMALKGVANMNRSRGNHIITTAIEHMSVINTCKYLTKTGFNVTYLPVDKNGLIDIDTLSKAITDKTILISLMYASTEIGTIEPIGEIGAIAREKGVYFHVDGTAAVGRIPVDVRRENIDLLTISSNDMYGPRGVGALYIRDQVRIEPIIHGGGQERGLRSGTENTPGIVGMGRAAEIARQEMEEEAKRLTPLRNKLIENVLGRISHSYLNGHPTRRLPNNANLRFSFIEGESLILSLDMIGVSASTGSACTSKTLEPSHVLTGIGLAHEEAHGSLLFTLGRWNTMEDVDYVSDELPGIVKRLRAISPLTPKEVQ
jgi:cysteine desulfurase